MKVYSYNQCFNWEHKRNGFFVVKYNIVHCLMETLFFKKKQNWCPFFGNNMNIINNIWCYGSFCMFWFLDEKRNIMLKM